MWLRTISKDISVINKQKNNVHAKIAREIINEHDSYLEKAIKWSQ